MRHLLAQASFFLAALTVTVPAIAGGLNLTVEGVRNTNGTVLVLVFDQEAAFEKLDWTKAVEFADIPARIGTVSYKFPALTSGPYAVFAFHDENGDQDVNIEGQRLLEGIGATGASTSNSNPSFTDAAVPPGEAILHLYYDR